MNIEKIKNKKIGILFFNNKSKIVTTTFDDIYSVLCNMKIDIEVIEICSFNDLISSEILAKISRCDIICKLVFGDYNRLGIVQGILDCLGKKYTGHLLKTDLVSQDKLLIKAIMVRAHINTPDYFEIDQNNPKDVLSCLNSQKRYILKPSCTNTSIGIMLPSDFTDLENQLEKLTNSKYGKYYVERYISGRILSMGIMPMNNGDFFYTNLLEYLYETDTGFMDENWKSAPKRSIAFDVPNNLLEEAKKSALFLHKAIDAKGATRTDFVFADGKLYALEINSNIGFSRNHDFPTAAYGKKNYEDLVLMYLETAY